jgi:hypothetical protein
MSSRRERLDRLLARGHLAGSARERILEGALREVGAAAPWYTRRFVLWSVSVPALAGGALVAAFTLRGSPAGMRAKGTASGATVSLECTRGADDVCSRQGILLFRVEALAARAYIAAYAQPLGEGERTWFFPPAPDADEPTVEPSREPQILRQGVQLRSVPQGRYDVVIVLSPRPITREDAVAPAGDGVVALRLPLSVGP